jgi:hypothetical protein
VGPTSRPDAGDPPTGCIDGPFLLHSLPDGSLDWPSLARAGDRAMLSFTSLTSSPGGPVSLKLLSSLGDVLEPTSEVFAREGVASTLRATADADEPFVLAFHQRDESGDLGVLYVTADGATRCAERAWGPECRPRRPTDPPSAPGDPELQPAVAISADGRLRVAAWDGAFDGRSEALFVSGAADDASGSSSVYIPGDAPAAAAVPADELAGGVRVATVLGGSEIAVNTHFGLFGALYAERRVSAPSGAGLDRVEVLSTTPGAVAATASSRGRCCGSAAWNVCMPPLSLARWRGTTRRSARWQAVPCGTA